MISMPERTDQRDGFSVAASLSGFRFVQDDGVDGSTVIPQGFALTRWT